MTIMLKFVAVCVLFMAIPTIMAEMTEEMKDLMAMLHNTCLERSGAVEDVVQGAQKGVFADDEPLKCYMKCLMDEMATCDDDGNVDVEAVIALLPPDYKVTLEPTIRKCGAKDGSSPCDKVFNTFKCHYETDPAHFFLV